MNATVALQALNAIQALLNWLAGRGLSRDRVQALLDLAASEDRDLTDTEVQDELNAVGVDLDDTAALIGRL